RGGRSYARVPAWRGVRSRDLPACEGWWPARVARRVDAARAGRFPAIPAAVSGRARPVVATSRPADLELANGGGAVQSRAPTRCAPDRRVGERTGSGCRKSGGGLDACHRGPIRLDRGGQARRSAADEEANIVDPSARRAKAVAGATDRTGAADCGE